MIQGVIPVLYSFYETSGALDLDAHVEQLEWVMARQAAGVTLLGLASEGAALTLDERRSIIARTAQSLPAEKTLLITTRPDDDLDTIARIALEARGDVGLIVQIGRDPAPSMQQIRTVSADPALAARVQLGLQLAPGLIDTAFSAAALAELPDMLHRISFLKAEYNSLELDAHLGSLGKRLDLLVGKNGQNLIDYLRIGATGVIPGTEMTAPLGLILSDWFHGQQDRAAKRYGAAAAYIDFAMQDLDTVIDVGRAVTARALGLERVARRRLAPARPSHTLEAAIDFWFAQWDEIQQSAAQQVTAP
jgi:4-hydroxy-tetrahydrodipicolinate synthase